jgi:hypothetical protein
MKLARSQKGLGMLGWLVTLIVVAFLATTAFKLFPHYYDFYSLQKVIRSVETDKAADVRTVPEFYNYVSKGMDVNAIEGIDLNQAMVVKLENNEFRVHLNYEKREPLIQNLDLVATFDKDLRVRMP